jgi:glycosyltransferase involved in cell wall biosynthesis
MSEKGLAIAKPIDHVTGAVPFAATCSGLQTVELKVSGLRKSTFVIIPAYNEAGAIGATVEPLIAEGYSVVVVDDHSVDETRAVAQKANVHYLRHPINLGQGAALQTGMDFALRQGAEFIVHFDADGQHRAEDISMLLEPLRLGQADVVIGSRFLRAEDWHAVPTFRRMFLRLAVLVNWLLTGVRLSDAHNGFRALTRSAAQQMYLRENRFAHASEIVVQIRHAHLRCEERPTKIVYTSYSKAKGQSLWNAFNIVVDLLLSRVF